MSAKIAPYLIDGVIDNSSYAKFPLRLVGFGKEIDFTKYFGCAANTNFKHLRLYCSDKTYWTINKESPNFFSTARKMIRYILEPNHLEIQAKYPKPLYVGYHSMYDIDLAPPDEKIELYEYFKKLNFDAKLTMIKDASQIDGKLIKNLEHGMGMSIKTLIQKELPLMLEKISKNKKNEFEKSNSISYPCDDLLYTFTQKNDKINLKITKVKKC